MANLLDRISIDPQICGGKPCIRGTRIWVSLVLDLLASGTSEAEIIAEYPALTRDDILAAIGYGAEQTKRIRHKQTLPRISKASGGVLPGVELTSVSALQEVDDLEKLAR